MIQVNLELLRSTRLFHYAPHFPPVAGPIVLRIGPGEDRLKHKPSSQYGVSLAPATDKWNTEHPAQDIPCGGSLRKRQSDQVRYRFALSSLHLSAPHRGPHSHKNRPYASQAHNRNNPAKYRHPHLSLRLSVAGAVINPQSHRHRPIIASARRYSLRMPLLALPARLRRGETTSSAPRARCHCSAFPAVAGPRVSLSRTSSDRGRTRCTTPTRLSRSASAPRPAKRPANRNMP